MKHIYFHIGMPKTGTTAIQHFLLNNKTELEKLGVGFYVPKVGSNRQKAANAYYLFEHFLIKIKSFNYKKHDELYTKYSQDLKEYAKQYDRLILSEEQFWKTGLKHKDIWQYSYDEIQEIIKEECVIHPVVYLRRQDDWILSMWKETMQSFPYDTHTIDELLEEERTLDFCNYNEKLKEIEEVFGIDKIIVRSYDRKQFKNDSIFYDFLDAIGVEWIDGFKTYEQNIHASITLDAAEAMNLINRNEVIYDKPDNRLRVNLRTASIVFSAMYPEKTKQYFMEPDERKAFLDKHIKNNQAIADRYNEGKPLFDYTIKPYEVWKLDYNQAVKNAEYIIKLSTLGVDRLKAMLKYINNNLK